jgi:hypothetical protein
LSSNDDDNELNHDPQYDATDESDLFVGKHYSSSRKTNKLHSATVIMFISDERDIDVGAIVTKWTMPDSANSNGRTLSFDDGVNTNDCANSDGYMVQPSVFFRDEDEVFMMMQASDMAVALVKHTQLINERKIAPAVFGRCAQTGAGLASLE